MEEITLDDMISDVQALEALIKEPNETKVAILGVATEIVKAAKQGKVEIFTDYDADGICSAYIAEKTIKSINPDCKVTVHCNDRRKSYGLSSDVKPDDSESRCVVLDMGSNQLTLAKERLGNDVIIIDHHLIVDKDFRAAFKSGDVSTRQLCNPHCFNEDDSKNAQYCATGIAYRIYQEIQKLKEKNKLEFYSTEKQDNTVAVMACIGTVSDMVDVLDVNSYNRLIIKSGLARINDADEQNLDFVIGNMLVRNGVGETITAHQLAFNVGAFLNSASRMSEFAGENGAQRMYDTITGDEHFSKTFHELDFMQDQNRTRKDYINELVCDKHYKDFVNSQRFGNCKNDNIGVYQLPNDVPAAMAGLIAGKLTEACDKAIVCLTYSSKKGYFTGSGRNSSNNETSLNEFIGRSVAREKEIYGTEKLQIKYGGHRDAIGVSSLNNIVLFEKLISENKDQMKAKSSSDRMFLKISLDDINTPETLSKMMMLEPIGEGLKIPPVRVEGTEQYRDKGFVKEREDWKRVQLKTANGSKFSISDWSYSPKTYPQGGKNGKDITMLAEIGINDFKGQHVELSAKFDRAFYANRLKEIERFNASKGTISEGR